MKQIHKPLSTFFILLLGSSLSLLHAGPIGSAGQRPPPGYLSQQGEQTSSAEQGVKDDAGKKNQDLKNKTRRSKQANQQVMKTLSVPERKQFLAIRQLARKVIQDPMARKKLQQKWQAFVKSQARKRRKLNLDLMVQAAMYDARQQQQQALSKALRNVQRASKQKQQLRTELKRARLHQQKMKSQPGKIAAYQPVQVKGLQRSSPVRSQGEMDSLITDMQNNMSTMAANYQQMMLALQNQMQHQARMNQLLSSIMKTMHDTAQSVIRNMR